MTQDIAHCARGFGSQCPKANDCVRVPAIISTYEYSWWFRGCSKDESGELDYYYFKPRNDNDDTQ